MDPYSKMVRTILTLFMVVFMLAGCSATSVTRSVEPGPVPIGVVWNNRVYRVMGYTVTPVGRALGTARCVQMGSVTREVYSIPGADPGRELAVAQLSHLYFAADVEGGTSWVVLYELGNLEGTVDFTGQVVGEPPAGYPLTVALVRNGDQHPLAEKTFSVARDGSFAGTFTVPATILQGASGEGAPNNSPIRLRLEFSYPRAASSLWRLDSIPKPFQDHEAKSTFVKR